MTLADAILLTALGACAIVSWSLLARRIRQGHEPLAFELRSPIGWTGQEALFVIAAYVACGVLGAYLSETWQARDVANSPPAVATDATAEPSSGPSPRQLLRMLQGKIATDVLFLILSAIVFRSLRPTRPEEIGLSLRPPFDLRVGIAAFFLIVSPVILLQAGLVKLLGESVHPVLLGLQKSRDVELWSWSALAVVGTAPLVEEFLFRGVIQNWLSRAWSFAADPLVTPAGEIVPPSPRAVAFAHDGPIVATAGLFALMHVGNGPDPIPLFFLALGLGYLFRQTNRIWAGWVVHLLLNSFSLAVLPFGL